MFFQHADSRRLRRWQINGRRLRAGGTRRRLLTLFVLVVGVIALLPWIVANTALRNVALSAALPSDAVRITTGGASLSWVSGPSLSGVQVTDSAGESLLAAEKISVDRPPGALLLNPHDLGLIEIVRPTLHLKVRPDGSNLEDVVQKLAAAFSPAPANPQPAEAAKRPLALAVRIIEATIIAEDAATGRQWRADQVNLEYDNCGMNGGLGAAKLSGQVAELQRDVAAAPAGRFEVVLQSVNGDRNQLTLQTSGLPLAAAEPWLRRFVPASELNGTVSGNGTATWKDSAGPIPIDLVTSGTLTVDRLDATAPALRGDRIKLARVELPWRLKSQPDGLAIEDLQLNTDIGQVALRGRLDPGFVSQRHDLELRGSIDAARLATMLPRALRVRDGTTITSGNIQLSGRCQPKDSGQLVTASVRTAELSATSAGKPFRWDQPVNASVALRRAGSDVQIDKFQCDSKFLKIEAAGTSQQFSANADFDLNALAEQLGQFIDLSGVQLAGTGKAKIDWQQAGRDQFTATATGDVAQLAVSLPDGAVWAEPQLAMRADAAGLLDPLSRNPTRVDSAKLDVNGQGDVLHAQLTSAVGLTSGPAIWPASIRATGRIARWLTRARPWFTPGEWKVDGQSELTADIRIGARAVEATNTKLVVTDLRAAAPGWNINESRIEFAGDARWNGETGELSSNSAQLVTSTITCAMRDVSYRAGEQSVDRLNGVAAFRTDLARITAWRTTPGKPPEYLPSGELSGNIRFAQQSDGISGELTATGQNLSLASRATASASAIPTGLAARPPAGGNQIIWQEPMLTLRGLARYQSTADRLTFEQLQIQSNTLQAAVGGTIDKLSTAADTNITGTLNYDLAQITPLLRLYLGNGIQLSGREQARFAVAGKLSANGGPSVQIVGPPDTDPYRLANAASIAPPAHWSHRVRAQIELPWAGANVYGLPVGAGRLAANLGEGQIRIEPLSLAVGEGQLTATPHVRFDPQPAQLSLPAGPLITNVRISPEVSEAMLKFVAPVLSGTTQSEGQFSLQLDGARVPLAEARRADLAGKLTVHSVRVVPGPMARELIGVAQQIESLAKRRDPTALATRPQVTLLAIRDQQVDFRVVEGRVHHQNMEFQVGDVTLRSQGSVGFDETIDLTLHVPVQDAWVAKEPLLAGLKGQTLQVPVSGTLTRPQIDQRVIAGLSQQVLHGAAEKAIGGELNKAFDKLFKSR